MAFTQPLQFPLRRSLSLAVLAFTLLVLTTAPSSASVARGPSISPIDPPTTPLSDDQWSTQFAQPGADDEILAVAQWNGQVVIGGRFTHVGGVAANHIAVWDGTVWHALAGGANNSVHALTVWNGDLIAGGEFTAVDGALTAYVAKWTGTAWQPLANGLGNLATSLAVYNGDLYAGGRFSSPGSYIARFDGQAWSPCGAGVSGGDTWVYALQVWNGALAVGGVFATAGDVAAANLAAWDGVAWTAIGSGTNGAVRALTVYQDELVAAGNFTVASSNAGAGATPAKAKAKAIASWNGSAWRALGTGMSAPAGASSDSVQINSLAGCIGELVAGGSFVSADGVSVHNVAKWAGSEWSAFGNGANGAVNAMLGLETEIVIAGDFSNIAGLGASRIARWDGISYYAYGPVGLGLDGAVRATLPYQDAMIMAGDFTTAGGVAANHIARFDGTAWSALDRGLNGPVYAMAQWGDKLVVAGDFTSAGGKVATDIAQWDGTQWQAFQTVGTAPGGALDALALYGGTLYAGGSAIGANGTVSGRLARWDTEALTWVSAAENLDGPVYALAAYGSSLEAGGSFSRIGTLSFTHNIAQYDGTTWSAVGNGLSGGSTPAVRAFTQWNEQLYVAGAFTTAGDAAASNIAAWDGSAWSTVGSGVNDYVNALAVYNGALVAGGVFRSAGYTLTSQVAQWNGAMWSAFASGVTAAPLHWRGGEVFALGTWNDGLYPGGDIEDAGGKMSTHLARWSDAHTGVGPPSPFPARGGDALTAWPNPVSTATTLLLPGAAPGRVRLETFDVRGALVAQQTSTTAGDPVRVTWSPRRPDGSRLAPGLYLLRAHSGNRAVATRVVVAP